MTQRQANGSPQVKYDHAHPFTNVATFVLQKQGPVTVTETTGLAKSYYLLSGLLTLKGLPTPRLNDILYIDERRPEKSWNNTVWYPLLFWDFQGKWRLENLVIKTSFPLLIRLSYVGSHLTSPSLTQIAPNPQSYIKGYKNALV